MPGIARVGRSPRDRRTDARMLAAALDLARKSEGHTRPNPPVGAVLVAEGRIVGAGRHRRCGGDHAEVAALKDARRRGFTRFAAATLYVTLEPCSRPGRVGACTDAIAASGVRRVVYAWPDPNPKNRGRATRVLKARGIACTRFDFRNESELKERFAALTAPFAKHVTTGLPYVTVKLAMSLDGKICDNFGDARWVSSAAARRATGRLRERMDAILVGAETVRRDNPSLLSHGRRNDDLVRVVVSRSGRLPAEAQIFTDGRNPTWTFVNSENRPDFLRETLLELGRRGIMHVLCEGGLKLATALAEAGLVDAWLTVLAPKVIGTRPIAKAVAPSRALCLCDENMAACPILARR